MANRPTSARLFVALDLPAAVRDELVAWRERAFAGRDELRLVAAEALHVTLVFLGHLPEAEIERVAALVRGAVPKVEAPLLAATAVKPVPPRRPRLIALDLSDEDARAAQAQTALADALADAELYEPEKRAFWPHVTLARARTGARVRAFDAAPPPARPWHAAAVTLYRSRVSAKGARYEALERLDLRPAR